VAWRRTVTSIANPFHYHNVIHAFAVDFRKRGWLSLRHSFEFVHGNRMYGDQVDWNAVMRRFHELNRWEALSGYTTFAHAYLGFAMPPGVKVQGWDRWRASFRLPRIVLASTRPLWNRVYRLRADSLPVALSKLRNLLRIEFYSGLWRECIDILRHT
jgi:hypothetical protein